MTERNLGTFIERGKPDGDPGSEEQGIDGSQVLSSYVTVTGLPWAVIVEEPVRLALADLATVTTKTTRYSFWDFCRWELR
jgi:hypothetical protein